MSGGEDTMYPCGTCASPVTWDDMGLCCDQCNTWFHATCQRVSNLEYENLASSDHLQWLCSHCKADRANTLEGQKPSNKWAINRATMNIGTLNIRGLKTVNLSDAKKEHIASDMDRYNLLVLAIQETHLSDTTTETIRATGSKTSYTLFLSASAHRPNTNVERAGVGMIVRQDINAQFTPISSRLCMLKIKHHNRHIVLINAYAPTQPVSEKHPERRESLYSELEATMRTVKNRDELIVLGDFNAKTGGSHEEYHQNMGPFGKGKCTNSNGKELLDFANRHDLTLSNTLFRHKAAHIATWEGEMINPASNRRNPYRNQIDYILVKTKSRHKVIDSRSHNGMATFTDHRMVRMKLNIKPQTIKGKMTSRTLDYEKLKDPQTRSKYSFNVELKLMDEEDEKIRRGDNIGPQEKWDMIAKANTQAAEEILGYKSRKRYSDPDIVQLSKEQQDLHQMTNSTADPEKRKLLKQARTTTMRKLHKAIKRGKEAEIEREIEEIENTKDDSNRMYKAVRNLQRMKKKEPLVVQSGEGITTDTNEQIRIVGEFFEGMFSSDKEPEIEDIAPRAMAVPFTEGEVTKAVKSLKNGKTPGIDSITSEQLKCGPLAAHGIISDILNQIAATGTFPRELNQGILIPLQKPGKTKGPPGHLRPIVLLSILRKILAICLLGRLGDRMNNHIPLSQAAYRSGRGTTEQLFAMKILAEKAITSCDYQTCILMMDMSKAFDTVRRSQIIEDLKQVLEPDELHLIKILIKDVQLSVKINGQTGTAFRTNIGTPQGDGLSPILFTLYLAKALTPSPPPALADHAYFSNAPPGKMIPLQYADDICWIGINNREGINTIKETIPKLLSQRNLQINQGKTEEFTISREGDDAWKTCKYLGTLMDTKSDIVRRKQLANGAMNRIKPITTDRHLDLGIKLRALNAYVASVFLYNSETWTLTKASSEEIDVFHRRLLRRILNIHYPAIISNSDLYARTKEKAWSVRIENRRLRFLGHILRLPEETPVRSAWRESLRPHRRPRGAPKLTWQRQISSDLKKRGVQLQDALSLAKDRGSWRSSVVNGCRLK